MIGNFFKKKTPNDPPGIKADAVILVLCVSVLFLLLAKNLLVSFKTDPPATSAVTSLKTAAPNTEERYKIDMPAASPKAPDSLGRDGDKSGEKVSRIEALQTENPNQPTGREPSANTTHTATAHVKQMESQAAATDFNDPPSEPATVRQMDPSDNLMSPAPDKKAQPARDQKPVEPAVDTAPPSAPETVDSPEKPSASPAADGHLYSVQVGTYKGMGHASRMVRTANAKGFEASVLRLKDGKGKFWYVVQTGTHTTRSRAESEAMQFKAATGISPAVVWISSKLVAERKIDTVTVDPQLPAPASGSAVEKPAPQLKSMGAAATDQPKKKTPASPIDRHTPAPKGDGDGDRIAPTSPLSEAIPDLREQIRRQAYGDAARAYRLHMARFPHRYTIRLEMDCKDESVQTAFIEGDYDSKMFLLPIRVKGSACYLVLWGLYESEKDAVNALPGVPSFFKAQTYPPAPVRIDAYLPP